MFLHRVSSVFVRNTLDAEGTLRMGIKDKVAKANKAAKNAKDKTAALREKAAARKELVAEFPKAVAAIAISIGEDARKVQNKIVEGKCLHCHRQAREGSMGTCGNYKCANKLVMSPNFGKADEEEFLDGVDDLADAK